MSTETTNKIKRLPLPLQNAYRRVVEEITQLSRQESDLPAFYDGVVNSIQRVFDHYSVNLYIVDPDKKWAVLKAGTHDNMKSAIEHGHKLAIDDRSLIGRVINSESILIARDKQPLEIPYPSVELPLIHSELCVLLISVKTKDIFGVLDVQSSGYDAFGEEDWVVYAAAADQIASLLDERAG